MLKIINLLLFTNSFYPSVICVIKCSKLTLTEFILIWLLLLLLAKW